MSLEHLAGQVARKLIERGGGFDQRKFDLKGYGKDCSASKKPPHRARDRRILAREIGGGEIIKPVQHDNLQKVQ